MSFYKFTDGLKKTEITVYQFIEKYKALGVQRFFCTDISKDGMLEGPAIDLYQKIVSLYPDIYSLQAEVLLQCTIYKP